VKTSSFEEQKQKNEGSCAGSGSQLPRVTAPPNKEMGGVTFEGTVVQVDTGTLDYGRGTQRRSPQVLAARLGVPFESIRLVQGDSDDSCSAPAPAARAR